jgi:drug/metabolite transporter (DMT)-like permease
MIDFMPDTPISLALLTAFSMATGQILFKLGAKDWYGENLFQWMWSFITNPFLVCAVFLYALTIIIWIYVLKVLPLSIAYPVTALSYVIVPIIAYFFLHEKVSLDTFLGSLLIIFGVLISHMQRS